MQKEEAATHPKTRGRDVPKKEAATLLKEAGTIKYKRQHKIGSNAQKQEAGQKRQ